MGTGDKGTDDKGTGDKGTSDKGTIDKGTSDKGTCMPDNYLRYMSSRARAPCKQFLPSYFQNDMYPLIPRRISKGYQKVYTFLTK